MLLANLRCHGQAPYAVVVVHGGPGARGSVAAIAREVSRRGISALEPLQTKDSVEGQLAELADCLERYTTSAAVLVGHSWGAWLGALLAARRPDLVRKLILVGCAPFEERYVARIRETRLAHVASNERREMQALLEAGADAERLFGLLHKADTYAADPTDVERSEFDAEIYARVWPKAAEMRRDGRLVDAVARIKCPVVAIHGSYDPHPAAGVREPLERVVKEFRWIVLDRCGHEPWRERYAREPFFDALYVELTPRSSSASANP
jgi:pimeloyl-ACP methyl ester carboxylesterase